VGQGLAFAQGVNFDRDGTLYCVDVLGGGVWRMPPGGELREWVHTGGGPNGSRFGPSGDLFVADYGRQAILRLSTSTGAETVYADRCDGRSFRGPNGMRQDSESVVGKSPVVGYASPFMGCVEERRMTCPYCQGDVTQELERATALGYRLFRCRPCRRTFNERTGTPFNHLHVPTDIALLVVLWRLRYKLSLRDLAEMFLTRGFTFTHETVREWEARFAPLLTERLRAKRWGKAGPKWHADETYVKVDGRWCYLYRAIDADGNLVDSMLSETRDSDTGDSPTSSLAPSPGLRPPDRTDRPSSPPPRTSRKGEGYPTRWLPATTGSES